MQCSAVQCSAAQTRHCQLVLPGGGDRIFAMTADGELAFTAPMEMMDHLIQGLRMSGRQVGLAYPIPVYQGFEPRFPPTYNRLFDKIT